MQYNMFLTDLAAAFVPLILGFIWYNPKVFGNAWIKAAGLDEAKMKGANMAVIFGVTFVLSYMLALALDAIVIHQMHLFSLVADDAKNPDTQSAATQWLGDAFSKYGNHYRTFKHGVFHGVLAGLFFAVPVLTVNALFERKGFKYIAINAGFWIVSIALMGGIICQFSLLKP